MLTLSAVPPLDSPAADELVGLARQLADLDDSRCRQLGAPILDDARRVARDHACAQLVLEAEPARDQLHDVATRAGFVLERELQQLRRSLPMSESCELPVRRFEAGRDDWAWLEVNNRAFAWHPDQAGWSVADVRTRQQEPWFDPAGFLLHERGGRLAGFCWTKVHPTSPQSGDPPLGEIYVIAVDPDFQGLGLGRALLLAGLDSLAERGLTTAMLYVEAENEPALSLYRAVGFRLYQRHRWYRADLTDGLVADALP